MESWSSSVRNGKIYCRSLGLSATQWKYNSLWRDLQILSYDNAEEELPDYGDRHRASVREMDSMSCSSVSFSQEVIP
ncbi:hypothetical protein EXIGLDRAFT_723352 [Exidia glandulosa HHB12029]|uniref:Uncharacterized protein n=1 Tax=Exidia glandulosa HHB12029 TaxID=1314781 RepID=A0A165EW21_EXIGL|nr:hypothetical protein EXIGLDRAFT_716845 [Exidia glandulosa HHB12029]KZV87817.1 hypothetical protein EXIGLDRAFT_723352 [Exidia glandulosa HHB12029]